MHKSDYQAELDRLQIALIHTQIAAIKSGDRVVIVLEGRDAAGKDGTIQRITERLSPRATRVVALPKPSDRERGQWYFQRYVAHLPTAGEMVVFNRSWYNRAGVERVMNFATKAEQEEFLRDAPDFERMLVESGVKLVKIWLDISRAEQKQRLDARRSDPLKALKVSDLDAVAQKKWSAYSRARNEMLVRTHNPITPWYIARANHKKPTRIAIIQHILHQIAPPEIATATRSPDPDRLFIFDADALEDGRLAR